VQGPEHARQGADQQASWLDEGGIGGERLGLLDGFEPFFDQASRSAVIFVKEGAHSCGVGFLQGV